MSDSGSFPTNTGVVSDQLAYRIAVEELVLEIFRRFMAATEGETDRLITQTLNLAANFVGVDMAHLFQLAPSRKTVNMTHVWRREPSPETAMPVKGIPVEAFSPDLMAGRSLVLNDTNRLAEDDARASMRSHGVHALLSVPVKIQDEIVGAVGLSDLQGSRRWADEELALLEFVAQTFGAALARSRVEEQKRDLEKRLRHSERMEMVGQLAGGIAHDFNNLLMVIQHSAELMNLNLNRPERLTDQIQLIAKASTNATELVRQLMTFSRKRPVRREVISPNDIVDTLLKMLRRLLPASIEVDYIPGFQLGHILADASQLELALVNLCVNARDAMPQGGRLTIETHAVHNTPGFSANNPWAKADSYVLISVADTGAGIATEHLEHIFEPFFTTKESGAGTGLGLATVYAILAQHQGMVQVSSVVNRGTVFRLYLPVTTVVSKAAPAKIAEPVVGGTETILLAEDEPQVREVIRMVLERAGYSVVTAVNGVEAIAVFRQAPDRYGLLLLDVVMPRMDGVEVAKAARQLRATIPVILSSGYTAGILDGTKQAPDFPLLNKPYDPDNLLRRIRQAIDLKVSG